MNVWIHLYNIQKQAILKCIVSDDSQVVNCSLKKQWKNIITIKFRMVITAEQKEIVIKEEQMEWF
jgi:hypothetical protein